MDLAGPKYSVFHPLHFFMIFKIHDKEMGPLKFIKQCEWSYLGAGCDFHSANFFDNYDWECNPLLESCPDGQYNTRETGK